MTAPSAPSVPPVVPSLPNLRDVGGHRTVDGRVVRAGRAYRSEALHRLADADLAAFGALGIRVVYDLRSRAEREAQPDRPMGGVTSEALDVLADSVEGSPAGLIDLFRDARAATAALRGGRSARYFEERYREFVLLPSARAAYGRLLRGLAEDARVPALFHCTTGKDRTGWIAAVLLTWLGVAQDAVMADYLASGALLEPAMAPFIDRFAAAGGDPDVLRPLVEVRPAYLAAGLAEVERSFGSLEAYLAVGLGLDEPVLERLRAAFLPPT